MARPAIKSLFSSSESLVIASLKTSLKAAFYSAACKEFFILASISGVDFFEFIIYAKILSNWVACYTFPNKLYGAAIRTSSKNPWRSLPSALSNFKGSKYSQLKKRLS